MIKKLRNQPYAPKWEQRGRKKCFLPPFRVQALFCLILCVVLQEYEWWMDTTVCRKERNSNMEPSSGRECPEFSARAVSILTTWWHSGRAWLSRPVTDRLTIQISFECPVHFGPPLWSTCSPASIWKVAVLSHCHDYVQFHIAVKFAFPDSAEGGTIAKARAWWEYSPCVLLFDRSGQIRRSPDDHFASWKGISVLSSTYTTLVSGFGWVSMFGGDFGALSCHTYPTRPPLWNP
jgi:hypothetical protein